MVLGKLKLGVKRPRSETLPSAMLRGFFYAGWHGSLIVVNLEKFPREIGQFDTDKPQSYCRPTAPATPNFQDNLCRQRHNPKRYEAATSFANALPAPFQDNFLPVMINKPFQSGAMVNSPKKVNCCTGWNRIHSTTKSRMNNKRGHHAGTAKLKQCPGSGDRLRPGTHNPLG